MIWQKPSTYFINQPNVIVFTSTYRATSVVPIGPQQRCHKHIKEDRKKNDAILSQLIWFSLLPYNRIEKDNITIPLAKHRTN